MSAIGVLPSSGLTTKATAGTDKYHILVRPTVTRPVQDPLAVQLLNNRLVTFSLSPYPSQERVFPLSKIVGLT